MFEVREYIDGSGRIPFRDWLLGLKDMAARARIRARIDRLQLGNFGDAKPIGSGVYELRLHFGPGYRVYFARHGKRIILLLCGGDKASQRSDIKRAQAYWADLRSGR